MNKMTTSGRFYDFADQSAQIYKHEHPNKTEMEEYMGANKHTNRQHKIQPTSNWCRFLILLVES